MILSVVDANGAPQQVAVAAPGTAADASGVVAANLPAGGPFTYQQLLAAVVGATPRGGWWIRNRSTHNMYVTEDGTVPSSSNPTAVLVAAGETFPPAGIAYPITQGAVLLAGTAADAFSAKVW